MVVFLKDGVGAVVYEQNDYAWYDIYAHLADGRGIGVTSNFKMQNSPKPPKRDYIITDDAPKDSYSAFMARLDQQKQRLYPIHKGNFVSMFESVYAEDMAWRKSQLNIKNLLKSLIVNNTEK